MAKSSQDYNTIHDEIYSQQVPQSVRRSAWFLFNHELERGFTRQRALNNVMGWIDEQRLMLERAKRRPTLTQLRILQMLARGMTQKQIALELSQHPQAIRQQFSLLRRRLGVETLYQVIGIATKKRWIHVETQPKIDINGIPRTDNFRDM